MNAALRQTCLLLPLLSLAAVMAGSGAAAGDAMGLRVPPDVVYRSAEESPGPVVFSHRSHIDLVEPRCLTCHPALFSILGPTGTITHEEMNAGRRCGACHDGTKASGVEDACDHCHGEGGAS